MTRPAPEPGETTAANARRVGMELRTARERLGWDRPAVAAGLRIKQAYLTAIEEGRLADLPGNTYAAGLLRTYASALGLDPGQVSHALRAEPAAVHRRADEPNRKPKPSIPAPLPGRSAPGGAVAPVGVVPVGVIPLGIIPLGIIPLGVVLVGVVLAAVVLAIAAYVGWNHFSASPQAASVPAARPALAPEPPAQPLPKVPTQPAAATPPPASAPSAAPVSTAAAPPGGAPAPGGSHGMMLRATAEAWVEVRETRGRVLLNRVLRSGETWPVPADQPQLLLSTGNAGGLELVVNGVASAPLGSSGAVRRDLPLDPALAGQGGLVPAAATAPAGSTAPPPAR